MFFRRRFYVALDGKDHWWRGTVNRPWRTIRYALKRMRAGQVVIVQAGRYFSKGAPHV